MTSFRGILGQSWNSEMSAILPYEILDFNFDLKNPLKLVIFPLWKHCEIQKKSSVTWSQIDKGMASSWKWHAC